MDSIIVEKIARIICREEAIVSAVESAGSLQAAYRDQVESILNHIEERAWKEHANVAAKILKLFEHDLGSVTEA